MRFALLLVVIAVGCGPTAEEDVCLRDCAQWHETCGLLCLGDDECAEDEFTMFCDERCLVDEGGDPTDCEDCFDCIEQNQSSRFVDGLDFCKTVDAGFGVSRMVPGFFVEPDEPCFGICNACE